MEGVLLGGSTQEFNVQNVPYHLYMEASSCTKQSYMIYCDVWTYFMKCD